MLHPHIRHRLFLITSLPLLSVCTQTHAQLVLNEVRKLTPSDGRQDDRFGTAVAISGNLAIIGATHDDDNGRDSGSAYVFDVTTGQQILKLTANDGAGSDRFGCAVSISGNIAVVGAYLDDDNGPESGSAYVFDVTTGQQLCKLISGDGVDYDHFALSVSTNGSLVLVGAQEHDSNGVASGAAYLFDAMSGNQLLKITPHDAAPWDRFGSAVAISESEEILVITASEDEVFGPDTGSAYAYNFSGGLIRKFHPSSGGTYDNFGDCVDISGHTIVLGAPGVDWIGDFSGAMYYHQLRIDTFPTSYIPADNVAFDSFGRSVGISNSVAIVGMPGDDEMGSASGSAYLIDIDSGTQIAKLLPTDGAADDQFGYRVAIDNAYAIVGVFADDDNGSSSGSAYIFSIPTQSCPPDVNRDGSLTPADFTAWIAAFNAVAPACDQNGDGSCTPADFTAWIANFNAGC